MDERAAGDGGAILTDADPPPVTLANPDGRPDVLVVCDHAAAAVPASLGHLGLAPSVLRRHIGWDVGAAAVATRLARLLDAPAIASGYSRLVIDCNRALDDPTSIPPASDGIAVPGNQALTGAARAARVEACFQPYHRTIARALDRAEERGTAPAVLSIHSFTPVMDGLRRPWQIGVLWDADPRIPVPLIANLATAGGLTIGDNEPYTARAPEGYTMRRHAMARGLPHVLIELRQDEIATDEGVERYSRILVAALGPILEDRQLYRKAFYR